MQNPKKLHSSDIQSLIEEWAQSRGTFTAPYGILTGSHTNSKGRKYLSVTFGYARSLDATVEIYNRSFIVVKTSSNRYNAQVFKSYEEPMEYLNTL